MPRGPFFSFAVTPLKFPAWLPCGLAVLRPMCLCLCCRSSSYDGEPDVQSGRFPYNFVIGGIKKKKKKTDMTHTLQYSQIALPRACPCLAEMG